MIIFIQHHPDNVLKIVHIVPLPSLPHVGICPHLVPWTPPKRTCLTVIPMMLQAGGEPSIHRPMSRCSLIFIKCSFDLVHQFPHNPACLSIIQPWILPGVSVAISP